MADTKISALSSASALDGTEVLPVVQGGATVGATVDQVATRALAKDAEIAALAGLTSAANKVPYFTGSGAAALADFSAAGRALVDDADAAAMRATLGLVAVASSGSAADLSAGALAAARMPALTGDVTTSAGAVATTLATVNSNVGSFTNANITVNAKGLITAAANGSAGGGLTLTTPTADAAVTCASNNLYLAAIGGYSADRIYTMPASPSVGDRVGILAITGNASFELIIKGNTSQTINGGSAASEWSRLFIAGEYVELLYTASNTWIVVLDKRIPMKAFLRLSTSPSANESAGTLVYAESASPTAGVWTADTDVGNVTATATGKIIFRRACNADVTHAAAPAGGITAAKYFQAALYKNSATYLLAPTVFATVTGTNPVSQATSKNMAFAVDDFVRFQYRSEEGSKGLVSLASAGTSNGTWIAAVELL